jgi:hypothetical protein
MGNVQGKAKLLSLAVILQHALKLEGTAVKSDSYNLFKE